MSESSEDSLKNNDPEVRRQALKDLQSRSEKPNIVPVLIKSLGDENWRVRNTAVEMLLDIRDENIIKQLINTLYQENANARNSSIEALIELGSEAIDYLINEFKYANADVRKFIIDILGRTGELKASPLLLEALEDSDENVKAAVVEHLSSLSKNISVINILTALLKSEDVWIAFHAADALGRIRDVRAEDALLAVLPRKELRKPVINALGKIAGEGPIPSLVPFLEDESRAVREEAVKALAEIFHGGISAEIVVNNLQNTFGKRASDLLMPHIRCNVEEVRISAQILLGLIMEKSILSSLLELSEEEKYSESAIRVLAFMGKLEPELLLPFFKADHPYHRRVICEAAGNVGSDVFFRPLVECLKDEDGHVRGDAALALSKMNKPEAIDYIKPLLLDEYENTQEEAVHSLSKFKQKLNVDEIIKGLSDNNPALRKNSVKLLGLLREGDSIEAVGVALKDSDMKVRRTAVEALSAIGGSRAVKFLLLALTDEAAEICHIAALEIGKLRAEEGTDPLIVLLRDGNVWIRTAAAEALGNIGSKKAVEPLIQLLSDESVLLKTSVIEALSNFREEKVKTALLQLLHDEDSEIRSAAVESLVFFDGILQDIVPLLKDREWIVRKKVVDVLGSFFKEESFAYLKDVAETDKDSQVKNTAEGYLHA